MKDHSRRLYTQLVTLFVLGATVCLLSSTHDLPAHAVVPPLPIPNTVSPMSTTNQTTDLSTANFTAIFDAASNEYKALTKQDLETHSFAVSFENSNSPDSVIKIFRKQTQASISFKTAMTN